MASEITLKYLHPSIKSYITTETNNYDTSISNEILFVADVFDHGKDNVLQQVNTVSEYLFKYGEPNLAKYGQAGYNVEKWLTNGGSAVIMRLLPENASYAHAVFNVQYKNSTSGKTVLSAEGDETKIDDVYLRPLVTYIGVNNTSEELLDSELSEDRSEYPTTDGYIDNFIFAVYPEGRGEYYNDLGFRIRLNPSYDTTLASRVYTFEVIKFTGTTYDIIDGPYYVTFDPDAIDPNSQRSMFIENVVNSYSEYVQVKFNTENYIKLATVINSEVDPYLVDIITGQSRILDDGSRETYFSSATGKNEDIHISLRKYSTDGIALTKNGDYILNISNNDESSSDIVDIADNARRVIYNNQKYVTDYMRTFYNWLLIDRVTINLNKILAGNIESEFSKIDGLLKDKVTNLIYNNITDSDETEYIYNGKTYSSKYVGKQAKTGTINNSWYLKAQEIINPSCGGTSTSDTAYEKKSDGTSDKNYISTSDMMNTITTDGFILETNEHLISYYNNFKKYFQFVCNYDIYNNTGYLSTSKISTLKNTSSLNYSKAIFRKQKVNTSSSDLYVRINNENVQYSNSALSTISIDFGDGKRTQNSMYLYDEITKNYKDVKNYYVLNANLANKGDLLFYFDDISETYRPIIDYTLYNKDHEKDCSGSFVKIYDFNGNENYINVNSLIKILIYDSENSGTVSPDTTKISKKVINETEYFTKDKQNRSRNKILIFNRNKSSDKKVNGPHAIDGYLNFNWFIQTISSGMSNISDYNMVAYYADTTDDFTDKTYSEIINSNLDYEIVPLESLVKIFNDWLDSLSKTNTTGIDLNGYKYNYYCVPVGDFYVDCKTGVYDASKSTLDETKGTITKIKLSKLSNEKYYNNDKPDSDVYNIVFTDYLRNGKLSQAYNKVSSYASLISKELDGKGKDIINNLNDVRNSSTLNYSDYSLTTIFNFLIGGFEAIVNNQGSITDYSNYASLKYLMKSINNNLDLRSTYLTLLNVHKNTILDLSTDLAKLNASVILGDETLDTLYTAMDTIVVETNYLITSIVKSILNKTYTIQDVETMKRVDNDEDYAYYFSSSNSKKSNNIDPLGITNNIDKYGIDTETKFYGIMPVLEKILINITGENHLGKKIQTIYGGQCLVDMYNDIKEGYTNDGLTQAKYEQIYEILSNSLSILSDVHNIINTFINEKYISEIIDTLVGTIDVDNTVITYKGKNFNVNTLFEYFNSGEDEDLTQEKVVNLINNSIEVSNNNQTLPIKPDSSAPVMQYPYFCIQDIIDSCSIAKENKDIIKNNILKQDHVLATLNTLCYDNLVQDISSVIGFANGSDGDFTYDNSTTAKLKEREHKINDIRIKAYKGTWNPDVLNKDLFEFDHIFDANYPDAVKNAIITLARDERQDFFYWADTKIQNTVQDCLDWKSSFTNSTYFMSIISQSQTWYDEYTSKNIEMTSTYLIADLLNRHINAYGIYYPMAGSRRGVVGGFLNMDWYPNEEQKENLYKNKVNYIERDVNTIRIGSQNTNSPTGPLGSINNMLVVLKVKRKVEKIAKQYQFEFNTSETRQSMNAEINEYLSEWVSNGACTVCTASVYASDYDISQKIVRVDIEMQFTGVIERIIINIDCPAS